MCNHFRNHPEAISTWREYIGADLPQDEFSEIKIDVWPKKPAIIARDEDGRRILDTMHWGVPLKMKGKRPGRTVTKHITNVRNLSSPFWRSMLSDPASRCLVPFNEFAEPKPNAGREECWFTVTGEDVSAFAGIWRITADGPAFAFLTCEPNPLVKPIHPKAMPVILHPEDYERWLAGEDAAGFAQAFPSQLMAMAG